MPKDKLNDMFEMRESFMRSLIEKFPLENPTWPLELSKKSNQQYCRDIALRGVEEMFEALQHLKNWKPHRSTEVTDFRRDEFLEEIVDAFNYFLSLIILTGHSSEDLYEAYVKKDKIIHERLKNGY
jgi:predicted house-cleaning noncanonical NTP pyrophosphatase (MazG superfamily)